MDTVLDSALVPDVVPRFQPTRKTLKEAACCYVHGWEEDMDTDAAEGCFEAAGST